MNNSSLGMNILFVTLGSTNDSLHCTLRHFDKSRFLIRRSDQNKFSLKSWPKIFFKMGTKKKNLAKKKKKITPKIFFSEKNSRFFFKIFEISDFEIFSKFWKFSTFFRFWDFEIFFHIFKISRIFFEIFFKKLFDFQNFHFFLRFFNLSLFYHF